MTEKPELYYRVVEEAVIAPAELATRIDRIHTAIGDSKTWGEFRQLMPSDDYEELMQSTFDEDGETRPGDLDEFCSTDVPGYADADYPMWLQPRMAEWIPEHLLKKYGSWEPTTLSGSYWAIPESNVSQLINELRQMGFTVTERGDLEFA